MFEVFLPTLAAVLSGTLFLSLDSSLSFWGTAIGGGITTSSSSLKGSGLLSGFFYLKILPMRPNALPITLLNSK